MRKAAASANLPDRSAYTIADQERMSKAVNYFAWQYRMAAGAIGRRVLEVGCGLGNFTGHLLDREAVIAIDEDPECVRRIRLRYAQSSNLTALVCDLAGPEFQDLRRFEPDTCVCLNVLEHIEDDRAALDSLAAVLAARGVMVLLVPAFPALLGPIDRNLGHFRRYRRADVVKLAEQAGLRIRELHYMNAAGFFGWWINAHILRREAQSERQIEIFDEYFVPVLELAEGWLKPAFGQSLLAVLEKS